MLSLRRALASAMVVAVGMTALLGVSGCEQSRSAAAFRPLPDLQPSGLRQLWERRVTLAPGEEIVNTWRVGDSIYVATDHARVVRLNASAGNKVWEVDLVDRTYNIFRPSDTPGGNNVLIVNRGKAFLVDKVTGDIVLQKPLEFAVNTDPIVAGNTFCVGGVNYFYALYLDKLGGKKWVTAAPNDAFVSRPAIAGDDSLVLASERGKLWKVNINTGDWAWKDHKTNGSVTGGPTADARAAYVPCLDGNVYAFDMNFGSQLWNTPLQGTLDRNLMVTRSQVLVPTSSGVMYALSTTKGDVRWTAQGVKDIGTLAGDRVWVMDSMGTLKALSLETGETIASATIPQGSIINNTADRNVFVVTRAGVVASYTAK